MSSGKVNATELAAALIEQIEVGQPDPDTGEQQVRITWKC